MKLLTLCCFVCALLLIPFTPVFSQQTFRSDAELTSLVTRYVSTPITRTTAANGDVFLQRDITTYLKRNEFNPPEAAQQTHAEGHDHKSDMLLAFLNRPHPSMSTMKKYFEDAAQEYHVPVVVLQAIAQVQSNWAQVSESMYGSWGVMGIIENPFTKQITKATSLTGISADDIKNNAKQNIRAAAALLASYRSDPPSADPQAWFSAVSQLTGLTDANLRHELAERIYNVMRNGSKTVSLWGEIIYIHPLGSALPEAQTTAPTAEANIQAVDYPTAVSNFTTCNFGTRPAGAAINFYFVHYVAVGTYQGAIDWFKNCTSGVSAHYVVRNSDGQVSQVVQESDRAFSQGVAQYNNEGIGVEHEVLAANLTMWDSEPMLRSAAALCANVCDRNTIPRVRRAENGDRGIYGHSDVRATDCPNMTPARWNTFLGMVANVQPYLAPPVLYTVMNPGTATQLTASWRPYVNANLVGYRLYYATDDAFSSWALVADETVLPAGTNSINVNASQFQVPPAGDVYHFRLTAIVADGANPVIESAASDVYSRSSNSTGSNVLIVDGFDRYTGSASYKNAAHPFVTSYFKSLRDKGYLRVSSVANERVEDGTVSLSGYDIVIWFVGDESSADVVFSAAEKTAIRNYLDNGGKMIVSGSEIAYNVGRPAAAAYDATFTNGYLKSTYVGDGAASYTPATGIAGTPFEGLTIPFGVVYPEDFPDAINAVTGATNILNYSAANMRGGVAYKGVFGAGTNPGGMIYLSFTLETAIKANIDLFMERALAYFDEPVITTPPTAVNDAVTARTGQAKRISILANDQHHGTLLVPGSVTITSAPANGTATVNAQGEVTYISGASFTGTDNFQYTVSNSNNQTSNAATVTITVEAATGCDPNPTETDDNAPKRDLRGAWVSTVSNIDWPSARTLTTAQQQTELIRILDTLQRTGINTVFLQVRPESDALYASTIEPWSYFLTGGQGNAPSPLWDPLTFAIEESHKRGIELHAWINPYRAKQATPTLAANHVATLHPDWTFVSGTATLLNPGLPDVRTYLTSVITDIVSRYAVDGIHFDDYFYPYDGMAGQDAATFVDHNPEGIATIEDWRRDNINKLIANVYDAIAVVNTANNRNVIFGVSPFGIWKSGTPAGITGTSSFSQVYCDPIAWMQAGKVDYVAPQLYWRITGPQDYNLLVRWWNEQGALYNRHVYPGLALYKMTDANNWAASEIQNQIDINRIPAIGKVKGQILFSTRQLMADAKGLKTALQQHQHKYKSLPPVFGFKDDVCPLAPTNVRRDGDTLRWDVPPVAADGDLAKKYVVYQFAGMTEAGTHVQDARRIYAIVPSNRMALNLEEVSGYFAVTALDKNNNESVMSSSFVLPITGLQFTARLSGNTVLADWKTLSETNTSYFELQRSADGVRFGTVGTVEAAGNSSSARLYAYQDVLTAAGTYYYRVRSVDMDGRSTVSDARVIVYNPDADYIVGPNPFVSSINISNLSRAERVELVDMSGRVLVSRKLNREGSMVLDTPGLPSGVYHLKITGVDRSVKVVKLVKY